jgi:hypothetical protein
MYVSKTKTMMYALITIGLIKSVCAMELFEKIESAAAQEDTSSLDDGLHCTIIKYYGSLDETKMDIITAAKTSQIIVDLSDNNLDNVTDNLFVLNEDVLKRITDLYLRNNPLTELPTSLKNLKWLKRLDLENTLITQLPEWFYELTALECLDIRNNPPFKLPFMIVKLPNLKCLWLDDKQYTNLMKQKDNGDERMILFLDSLEKKGVRICAPMQQKKLADQKYTQSVGSKFNFEEYYKSLK